MLPLVRWGMSCLTVSDSVLSYYAEAFPPSKVSGEAERVLEWCSVDLRLSPRPRLRFVVRCESPHGALFAFSHGAGTVGLGGLVLPRDPNTVFVNVSAFEAGRGLGLVELVAHECRHVWQGRSSRAAFSGLVTELMEADAVRYARGAAERFGRDSAVVPAPASGGRMAIGGV